jgi:hypothetical protein
LEAVDVEPEFEVLVLLPDVVDRGASGVHVLVIVLVGRRALTGAAENEGQQ